MKAFQLKIVIKNSKPPIWRRVIVPAGITFSQLSMILNKVMGWSGYHAFEFEFYHLELRLIEEAEEFSDRGYQAFDYLEASETYIREYLEQNEWFTYTYDLGDDWQHRVTVEKIIEDYEFDYPQILKYKGDCPVEDCGGIDGYYECLEIISDKNNPEYEERLAWMEMQGYPDEYDMTGVNETLREQFFYRWGKGEKWLQGELYNEHFSEKYGLNATKKDKNKDADIIKSRKHQLEETMEEFASMFRQKGSWQDMFKEISLRDIFSDFDKESLVEIAEEKGMQGIAGCSKPKLIEKLCDFMLRPEEMKKYFVCMHDSEVAEFEKAVLAKGMYVPEDFHVLITLCESNYIGMFSDGSLKVPMEVAKIYETLKGDEFQAERKRTSNILCCLRAASVLYGIFPFEILAKLLGKMGMEDVKEEEIKTVIANLPALYATFIPKKNLIYHAELYPDDEGVLAAQGDKEYYIPTVEEIMELGLKGYFPESKELVRLERYLINKLDAWEEDAKFAARIIQRRISISCEMQHILAVLEEFGLEAETIGEMNGLVKCIIELWNNTRMLRNRGFSPNELQQSISSLPVHSNVISFEQARGKKVYPNAPCPCGSGKKYKNCCKNKK